MDFFFFKSKLSSIKNLINITSFLSLTESFFFANLFF